MISPFGRGFNPLQVHTKWKQTSPTHRKQGVGDVCFLSGGMHSFRVGARVPFQLSRQKKYLIILAYLSKHNWRLLMTGKSRAWLDAPLRGKSTFWAFPSRDRARRSHAGTLWIKDNLLIYRTLLKCSQDINEPGTCPLTRKTYRSKKKTFGQQT